MIKMQPVKSSNIEAIGYDDKQCDLFVRFHTGATYVYHGVPVDVFRQLMNSDSKGRYLNRIIKPSYRCEKQ